MDIIINNLNVIYAVALLASFGVLIRISVAFAGQNWIKSASHSVTLILLPIITYCITSVISGNIALSLGMVGALSIVRFRNPVKSPFELVVYFLMISLGICAAVSFKWLLLLGVSSCSLLISIELLNRANKKLLGRPLFLASFSEGNSLHTIDILSDTHIADIAEMFELIAMHKSGDDYGYRLATADREKALQITEVFKEDPRIKRISYVAA
jgi:hypothetical protein